MLEPLAPGTEDEFQLPQVTKKETEQERLLSQKAYLSNGKYGNVFELTFVNGIEHWYCNICQCPVMGRAYHHEIGKRHTNNMSASKNKIKTTKEQPEPEPEPVQIDIAPGEPVPPGFENEVQTVAQIQERLNGYNVGPLVGLEYVLELQDIDLSKEPCYLCILCDKKGDPRTVLTHLSSYNHISQYLQKHFRVVYRALAPYMTKQYKRNWQNCLQKVAEAIERRFGRLFPMPISQDKFEKNRLHYLGKIAQGKHFQEGPNCTFEELVKKEEMTKSVEEESAARAAELSRLDTARVEMARAEEKLPFRKNTAASAKRSPSPPVVHRPLPTKKSKPPAATGRQNQPGNHALPRKKSLSPVSSVSSSDGEGKNAGRPRAPRRSPRNDRGPVRRRSPSPYNRSKTEYSRNDRGPTSRRSPSPYNRRPYRRSPSPKRKMDTRDRRDVPPPWQRPSYSRPKPETDRYAPKKSEKEEKMEEFKKLIKAIENDMERIWKQHEKNPEKHPHYNEEWKKFWNKRYKELQAEGKDASKHDFKPEWIVYWNKRMKETHDEELKVKKEALRKRLGLVDEPTPIKFRIQNKDKRLTSPAESKKPIPPAACPDSDPEVIVIDDKDDTRSSKSVSRRSPSPDGRGPPAKQRRTNNRQRGDGPAERQQRDRRSPDDRRPPVDRRSPPPPVRRRSVDRRSPPPKRRSIEKSDRRQERRSEERRSRDGRSLEKKSDASKRSIERRSAADRRSNDRKSLDRLSLDRISSSASSSDELSRPDKYYDDYRPPAPRERAMSPGVHYVRERDYRDRDMAVRNLPYHHAYYGDLMKPPKMMREATRGPMMDGGGAMDDDADDGDINVVGVLRLLTALEEKLGSLGPKVNDLLAQALAMEKNEANSSETLLDNDINCVLFETVKEKLKGQLQAGLVEYVQEKAFKKAIKKSAGLVHVAAVRKQEKAKLNPVKVAGVGSVDKAAIARQIATALVLQGKTDVTQAELETLINAVVGMAEASQKTEKPMTTASFIEQISGALSKKPPQPEEKPDAVKTPEPSSVEKAPAKEAPKPTERQKEAPQTQKVDRPNSNTSIMDHLSDSDLQTLLQNFKDLSNEEQHGLISYLKKLEAKEPDRVEKLRQFVNLSTEPSGKQSKAEKNDEKRSDSPPGSTSSGANREDKEQDGNEVITIDEGGEKTDGVREKKEKEPKDVGEAIESDEEDYNFDDVLKAVSKNVEAKEQEKQRVLEEEKKKQEKEQLKDTQALISNLISNFSKANSSNHAAQPTVTTADFTRTLTNLPINLDNLANIVGNVKTLQEAQNQQNVNKTDIFEDNSNSSFTSLDKPNIMPEKVTFNNIALNLLPKSQPDRPQDRKDELDLMMGMKPPVPPFGANGPPFGVAAPAFGATGPAFAAAGPPFGAAGPAFGAAGPPFGATGPPFGATGPPFGASGPAFAASGPALGASGPPVEKRPPAPPVYTKQPVNKQDGQMERPFFDRPDFSFDRERQQLFNRQPPMQPERSPVAPLNRPGGLFDRQGSLGFDRPGPGDRPGPPGDRSGPGDRAGPGDRSGPGDRAGLGNFDCKLSGFNPSTSNFDKPRMGGFDRPDPGRSFERTGPGNNFDRPGPGGSFDRPGPGGSFERSGPGGSFERSGPGGGYDRPGPGSFERPGFDRNGSFGYDRQGNGQNSQRPDFGREAPEFDRPSAVSRQGQSMNKPMKPFDHDQFDIERAKPSGAPDDFDIPGPDNIDRRDFDKPGMKFERPLSDRLAPAMNRLNSADRLGGAIQPLMSLEMRRGGGAGMDRFPDRSGEVDRADPFIPSLNSQDRGIVQYPTKSGVPVRGKNPQYSANSGFDESFDDGFASKPFNARGRGGFNRW